MSTSNNKRLVLRWHSIDVVCHRRNGDIHILHNVTGIAKPGRFLAILGSSGSGKTTLLNALTFRSSTQLSISGRITANNRVVHGERITKLSAYVQQNDVFFGILTAREHLWLQAMLRIDRNVSKADKEKRVDEVMAELGLAHRHDTRIGNTETAKTLSGGERKRLSLAAEILSDPSLLFCDEPTSGLDSFMAENVILKLKDIAKKGKTVVCVIHQPSSEVFNLFDDLLIIAKGRTAYLGPSHEAKDYFSNLGMPCPPYCNLAEYFMKLISVVPGREDESQRQIQDICDNYQSIETTSPHLTDKSLDLDLETSFRYADLKTGANRPGFFQQLRYVCWRTFIVELRDRHLFLSKTCPSLAVSFFLGLVYLMQENNQRGTENLCGALFMVIALATFTVGFCLIGSFPLEFPTVKRDIENRTYSVLVYYLSKTAADMVIFTVLSILMGTIIYWMIGLRGQGSYFIIFLSTFVLVTYVIIGYAYTISCAVGDVQIAPSFFGPLVVPALTFGGFVLNDASIPKYFIWLEYLSWFKYANSIFMINQWHEFGNIECEYEETESQLNSSMISGDMSNNVTLLSSSTSNYQPFQNTDTSLSNFSANNNSQLFSCPHVQSLAASRCYKSGEQNDEIRDFMGLTGLLISLRLAAYICLYLRMHGYHWLKLPKKTTSQSNTDYVHLSEIQLEDISTVSGSI